MINGKQNKRALIEGRAALIVIDIQQSTFVEKDVRSIPHMADYAERMGMKISTVLMITLKPTSHARFWISVPAIT